MHLIITDAWLARRQAVHLSGWHLAGAMVAAALALVLLSTAMYHWVFLQGLRQDWPVVSQVARLLLRNEMATREAQYRDSLDAMAKHLGTVQARLAQLESLGARVASLAGVEAPRAAPAGGGVLLQPRSLDPAELQATLEAVAGRASVQTDWLTLIESRLMDQKVREFMVPTVLPVDTAEVGSGFGWRIDPITGQSALHSGLDFPAEVGHPIMAAAGGVVVLAEAQPAYGNTVEIDHGNGLLTRYAHASRIEVRKGDLVRRGQRIGAVGNTGRSTGPHLHFEVLVAGVPQDPQKFLAAGRGLPDAPVLARSSGRGQRQAASAATRPTVR